MIFVYYGTNTIYTAVNVFQFCFVLKMCIAMLLENICIIYKLMYFQSAQFSSIRPRRTWPPMGYTSVRIRRALLTPCQKCSPSFLLPINYTATVYCIGSFLYINIANGYTLKNDVYLNTFAAHQYSEASPYSRLFSYGPQIVNHDFVLYFQQNLPSVRHIIYILYIRLYLVGIKICRYMRGWIRESFI